MKPTLEATVTYIHKPISRSDDSPEIQIHSGCGGLVRGIGNDGISYCEGCEHICEGDTEYITEDEWEKSYS